MGLGGSGFRVYAQHPCWEEASGAAYVMVRQEEEEKEVESHCRVIAGGIYQHTGERGGANVVNPTPFFGATQSTGVWGLGVSPEPASPAAQGTSMSCRHPPYYEALAVRAAEAGSVRN